MITNEQATVYKSVIGKIYADGVYELLVKRGIKNKKGKFHNNIMIALVMNGHRGNADIEQAILDLYKIVLAQREELNVFLGINPT